MASVPKTVLICTLPASATEVASSEIGQEILSALETRVVRVGSSVKESASQLGLEFEVEE